MFVPLFILFLHFLPTTRSPATHQGVQLDLTFPGSSEHHARTPQTTSSCCCRKDLAATNLHLTKDQPTFDVLFIYFNKHAVFLLPINSLLPFLPSPNTPDLFSSTEI